MLFMAHSNLIIKILLKNENKNYDSADVFWYADVPEDTSTGGRRQR
jgi:hypothetical protein